MSRLNFWDKFAEKYSRQPIKDMAAYDNTLARTAARLTPGDHVMEIGCGTGTTALRLAEHVQRITASDISENMIAIARQKATDQNIGNVEFFPGEAATAPKTDGGYDAVVAFNLLHLLENPEQTMAQIHDRLKPGGYFISKTICLGDRQGFLRPLIFMMQIFGRAPYVRFLKTAELESTIEKAGFTIDEADYIPADKQIRFIIARKV
ncbi:MAG: class I SAM-dependent methyltransferase [Parvularculaceae bacterium]|nr:class I SAM-dependent methyltransferase [Parvularculaceae bacterium]